MLTLLNEGEDVVAARFKGRIESNDIARYVDRLECALETGARVHVYVETADFDGVDRRGIKPYLARGLRLLGRLKRLGRVALVSDTAWLRWAAKLESALLPYVRYETFHLKDRAVALAWVKGERQNPSGPAIRIIVTSRTDVLGFEIDGRISSEELHAVSAHLNRMLGEGRPLGLLVRIRRLEGFEPSCLLDREYLAMKLGLLHQLERYAVVGGPSWLARWIKVLDPLFRIDIRHFELEDETLAWAWLGAEPRQLQSLIA